MALELRDYLEQIVSLADAMLNGDHGEFDAEQVTFIETVRQKAQEIIDLKIFVMNLIGISANSHDLRRPLTALVGHSALLNSPKLSNHEHLTDDQREAIDKLHNLCRYTHWRLDNLVLFANQVVRPPRYKPVDVGMIDLGGYLRAQAETYVCKRHLKQLVIANDIPKVYANDTSTRLMLKGLFTVAIDLQADARLQLSAYTMARVVRVKLLVEGAADKLPELLGLMNVREVETPDHNKTIAMNATVRSIRDTKLLALGLHIATQMATVQSGRMKVDRDGDDLVFLLTMPTIPDMSAAADL